MISVAVVRKLRGRAREKVGKQLPGSSLDVCDY